MAFLRLRNATKITTAATVGVGVLGAVEARFIDLSQKVLYNEHITRAQSIHHLILGSEVGGAMGLTAAVSYGIYKGLKRN